MNKTLQGVVMDGSGSALVQTAQTFRVPQGEDWLITVPVKKQDGTAFDLTGFIGELEVKRTRLSSTPVFPKRYSDTIVSPTLGIMTFTGTRGDTLLAVPADCPFDVYVREIATNKAYRCIPETDTTGAHSIFTIEKAIVDLSAPGTPPAGAVALVQTNFSRIADTAIPQYALVKESTGTAGRVALFLKTDDPSLFTGVALQVASGAGVTISVMQATGFASPMLSDGTGTITHGRPVEPSPTVDGRIRQAATTAVCGVAQTDAAATLDAQVTVL